MLASIAAVLTFALAAGASAEEPAPDAPLDLFLPLVPQTTPDTAAVTTGQFVPPGSVYLTGLMKYGQEYVALLEDKKVPRSAVLVVGDELGPWRVERIEIDRLVLLKKDGTSETLELGQAVAAVLPTPEGADGTGVRLPDDASGSSDQSIRSIEEALRRRRESERRRF